jgi:hypothetical protein
MKKIAYLMLLGLILSILVIFSAFASDLKEKSKIGSSASEISGTISDKLTNEPLAGVEIKLMDTNIIVYTDFDGKFAIKDVKPGAYAIMVNYISYQDIVENIQTKPGNTTTVKLKLKSVDK